MIAREGRLPIAVVSAAAILIGTFAPIWWAAVPLAAIVGLTLGYLEPRIVASPGALSVLAPVDGRVRYQGEVRDPWLERQAHCYAIELSFARRILTVLYASVEGQVVNIWFSRWSPMDERLTREPERKSWRLWRGSPRCYSVQIRTDEGYDVVIAWNSRWKVSKLRLDSSIGNRVGHGRRCGFAYLVHQAHVFVPLGGGVSATPGDNIMQKELSGADSMARVIGGRSVLTTLPGAVGPEREDSGRVDGEASATGADKPTRGDVPGPGSSNAAS